MWTFAPKIEFRFGQKNRYGSHAIVNGLLGCMLIIFTPQRCLVIIIAFHLLKSFWFSGIGKFG